MANHARTKKKIKMLKLKAFHRRVIERRAAKLARETRPKGKTIVGSARLIARYIPPFYRKENGQIELMSHFNVKLTGRKNQRQKRKLWRTAPHMRKKAA